MMSKGFPPVPESILLEPDDVITYEEDPLTYVHDYTEQAEGEVEGEGDREGSDVSQEGVGNVRGVLTKRLWNYILTRCEIPADIKYVRVHVL